MFRRMSLFVCYVAIVISGTAHAQTAGTAPNPFDVVGLRLGQPLSEAIKTIRAYNAKMEIDTRRVEFKRWDACASRETNVNQSDCAWSSTGNWLDGLDQPGMSQIARIREQQSGLNEQNSLIGLHPVWMTPA